MKQQKVKKHCSDCKIVLDAGNKSAIEGLCLSCAKKLLSQDTPTEKQKRTTPKTKTKPSRKENVGENAPKQHKLLSSQPQNHDDNATSDFEGFPNQVFARISDKDYDLLLKRVKLLSSSISEVLRNIISEHFKEE